MRMTEPSAQPRKWTRLEYDRLVEAELLGPEDRIELLGGHMIVKEPPYSPHATGICLVRQVLIAAFGAGWIVSIPSGRVEVYREPDPDETAGFGWRYGRSITLGPDERVVPLAAPQASILVADLLP
jgi:hypothetical protein